MSEPISFVNIIDSQLTRFLADKRGEMAEISPDLTPLLDYSSSLLTGEKPGTLSSALLLLGLASRGGRLRRARTR